MQLTTPIGRPGLWLLLAPLALFAAAGPAAAKDAEDPLESVNRPIFKFNDAFDAWILKPVAQGYDKITPGPVDQGIGNVFENAGTPAIALNQLLQGKPRAALSDFTRFLVNTTVGLGGIFDIATRNGLPRHEEDFGQTFALWTGGQGPFLMLPGRGPATTTHAVGMVFNAFTNPVMLVSPNRDQYLITALDIVDTRAELLDTERLISGDRYLFIRDAYLQRRQYLINDGRVEEDPFLDDF
jgi:phospholipid-binding lipoprotein MlaA